jgi:hypothetical protein
MKSYRFLCAAAATLSAACGGADVYVEVPKQGTDAARFGSASRILAHLDGKTLVMEGAAIPSHPNGFDEDMNFGQATQCYHKVAMRPLAGKLQIQSQLGTLKDAPSPGDHGSCDHEAMSAELSFDSTAMLIENVKDGGACFDFTVTFPGFGQEGRGSIADDGSTFVIEMFFKDQATGHRCAQGNVGDRTVTLNQNPFTGNAQQRYLITE